MRVGCQRHIGDVNTTTLQISRMESKNKMFHQEEPQVITLQVRDQNISKHLEQRTPRIPRDSQQERVFDLVFLKRKPESAPFFFSLPLTIRFGFTNTSSLTVQGALCETICCGDACHEWWECRRRSGCGSPCCRATPTTCPKTTTHSGSTRGAHRDPCAGPNTRK